MKTFTTIPKTKTEMPRCVPADGDQMIEVILSASEQSRRVDLDLLSNFSNFDFDVANEEPGSNHQV